MRLLLLAAMLAAAAAARARKPSILLMFPDELRYDWGGVVTSPYYTAEQLPIKLPNIDGLAARGTRFTRAVVPSPVCAPSRACLASGREYDPAGQGENGVSVAPTKDGDFDVEEIPTLYQALQAAGYWTMVTGRDDLTKRTGPGLRGDFHTAALGFNDSARCGGSVDVTWGECGGADNGASPCAGRFTNESRQAATIHEPYGAWLAEQPVPAAVGARYNVSNYFELDFARYAELNQRGGYDSVHWYAIPDTLPFEQFAYQVTGRPAAWAVRCCETVQDMFITLLYRQHASHTLASRAYGTPATHAQLNSHRTIHNHGSKRTSGFDSPHRATP